MRSLFRAERYSALLSDAQDWLQDAAGSVGITTSSGGGEGDPDKSCVQFSSPLYYGDAGTGELEISIMRKGKLDTSASVSYATKDDSAKAGVVYNATSGVVTFEPGEYSKSITVTFVKEDYWSATVEFKVVLSDPQDCIVGRHGDFCRIKVLDDDLFPANSFEDQVKGGDSKKIKKIAGLPLYWAYCKWNVFFGGLVTPVVLTLIFDQLENIYQLVIVFIDIYLVNSVVNLHAHEDELLPLPFVDSSSCVQRLDNELHHELSKGCVNVRLEHVYFVAAIHVFPWAILLIWEYVKTRLDIEGRSTQFLQKHLYRKFMNLPTAVIEEMDEGLAFALEQEAPKVASGFAAGLEFIKSIVDLFLNIYFIAVLRPKALPYAVVVIITILIWGSIREIWELPGTKTELGLMSHIVKETATKHSMVCEYLLKPVMNEAFEESVINLRKKALTKDLHEFRTKSLLQVIAPIMVGIYTCYASQYVLHGKLGVGTFLGMIKVIHTVAKETGGCYLVCGDITHTFKALRNITAFYNKETAEGSQAAGQRGRTSTSDTLMGGMKEPDVDDLPIQCSDVSYSFQSTNDRGEEQMVDVLSRINFKIQQGGVIGIHGPNASGKNLLLSLLAQLSESTGGKVYVPSHLRSLLVSQDVMFMDRSLTTNLTAGCDQFKPADVPRLEGILKDLGLMKLIDIVKAELKDPEAADDASDTWSQALSHSEKARVALARAFVMNPEVMLLQKPLHRYGDEMQKKVQALFKQHVELRGLRMEKEGAVFRRPRTLIYTADTKSKIEGADKTWEMVPTGIMRNDGSPTWTLKT